jgi:ADP-ribose pyrophosphatase
MIERTTRKDGLDFDGVDIIAIIKYVAKKPKLILIANYRAPVDNYVLEFPAGLMDDEHLEENAIRELKEETGYTAKKVLNVISKPTVFSDPWKSNENSKIV